MIEKKPKIPENNMSFKDQDDLTHIAEAIQNMCRDEKNVPIDKKNLKMLEDFLYNILRIWTKNNDHYIRLLKAYDDVDSELFD